MKAVKLLICASILSLNISLSFGQSWDWGIAGYSSIKSNDYGTPVAVDKSGNAYISGQYETSLTFGAHTLNDYSDNVYLAKFNPSGTFLWEVQPPSDSGISFGTSLATSKSGSIYITGWFSNILDFGAFSLNTMIQDVFLVKYSSTGNVKWAKQSVSGLNNNDPIAYSIATDKSDNVFITGTFAGTITFGSNRLSNILGSNSVFIVKYDSSGNALWAEQATVLSGYSSGIGYSVATDSLGNAFICGTFIDSISFGPYKLINPNGSSSEFIAKYSSSGSIIWVEQSVNNSNASNASGYAVITDKANNAYITGDFEDTVKFGSKTLYSSDSINVFLTKYDANGDVSWAKQSSPGWQGSSLASDKINNIYLGGQSQFHNNHDTLKFGNYKLHSSPLASSCSFLMRFDTTGTPICGSMLNNLGYYNNVIENSPGIATDSSGTYIYMAGTFFNDTIKCGPDILIASNGGDDVFVGRWLNCAGGEEGVSNIQTSTSLVSLFPNPNSGKFTIQSSGSIGQSSVQIYNVLGEKVYSQYSLPNTRYQIDLSSQPNGIYFYRVISEDGNLLGDGKVIIEK